MSDHPFDVKSPKVNTCEPSGSGVVPVNSSFVNGREKPFDNSRLLYLSLFSSVNPLLPYNCLYFSLDASLA